MQEWLSLSELARNWGLVVAGALGLVLAAMRVRATSRQSQAQLKQAELARRAHVAELFDRAVSQLDDPKLQIRLGAIYVLRQIGEDFPDLSGAVYKLLTIYLSEHQHDYGNAEPPPDFREIIDVLTSRRRVKR